MNSNNNKISSRNVFHIIINLHANKKRKNIHFYQIHCIIHNLHISILYHKLPFWKWNNTTITRCANPPEQLRIPTKFRILPKRNDHAINIFNIHNSRNILHNKRQKMGAINLVFSSINLLYIHSKQTTKIHELIPPICNLAGNIRILQTSAKPKTK